MQDRHHRRHVVVGGIVGNISHAAGHAHGHHISVGEDIGAVADGNRVCIIVIDDERTLGLGQRGSVVGLAVGSGSDGNGRHRSVAHRQDTILVTDIIVGATTVVQKCVAAHLVGHRTLARVLDDTLDYSRQCIAADEYRTVGAGHRVTVVGLWFTIVGEVVAVGHDGDGTRSDAQPTVHIRRHVVCQTHIHIAVFQRVARNDILYTLDAVLGDLTVFVEGNGQHVAIVEGVNTVGAGRDGHSGIVAEFHRVAVEVVRYAVENPSGVAGGEEQVNTRTIHHGKHTLSVGGVHRIVGTIDTNRPADGFNHVVDRRLRRGSEDRSCTESDDQRVGANETVITRGDHMPGLRRTRVLELVRACRQGNRARLDSKREVRIHVTEVRTRSAGDHFDVSCIHYARNGRCKGRPCGATVIAETVRQSRSSRTHTCRD